MRLLSILLTASFLSVPALAADEFGQRFGNNTPYALNNDIDSAVSDTAGFDMGDLNDISPASGDEMAEEVDAETETAPSDETMDAEHDHGHGDEGYDDDHEHGDEDHDHDHDEDASEDEDATDAEEETAE